MSPCTAPAEGKGWALTTIEPTSQRSLREDSQPGMSRLPLDHLETVVRQRLGGFRNAPSAARQGFRAAATAALVRSPRSSVARILPSAPISNVAGIAVAP